MQTQHANGTVVSLFSLLPPEVESSMALNLLSDKQHSENFLAPALGHIEAMRQKDTALFGCTTTVKNKNLDNSSAGQAQNAERLNAALVELMQERLNLQLLQEHIAKAREVAIEIYLEAEQRAQKLQEMNHANESRDEHRLEARIAQLEKTIEGYEAIINKLDEQIAEIDDKIQVLTQQNASLKAQQQVIITKQKALAQARAKYGQPALTGPSAPPLAQRLSYLQTHRQKVLAQLAQLPVGSKTLEKRIELEGEKEFLNIEIDRTYAQQAKNDPRAHVQVQGGEWMIMGNGKALMPLFAPGSSDSNNLASINANEPLGETQIKSLLQERINGFVDQGLGGHYAQKLVVIEQRQASNDSKMSGLNERRADYREQRNKTMQRIEENREVIGKAQYVLGKLRDNNISPSCGP